MYLHIILLSHNYVAIHDNNGTKLIHSLKAKFQAPEQTQIRHNFLGTINPICSYGSKPKTTVHFLLRCQNHVINRSKLLKNVYNLNEIIRNYDDDHLIHTLLYGSKKFNFNLKKEIIKLAICYLKDTERFDESLI